MFRRGRSRRQTAPAPDTAEEPSTLVESGEECHLVLDYPVRPRPRFGHELPRHDAIERVLATGRTRYRARLREILEVADGVRGIPLLPTADPEQPYWQNGYLPGLDGAALYSLLVHGDPATYLEVGSGNSTRFARRAIRDHGLRTKIVSIDPHPRAEVDAICDEVVRSPLEDAELGRFGDLEAGDVVFVDNSHRVFTNSDATVVFLEVLPALKPGVLVQIHDVFLPDDYPAAWNDRYYSEQYLLAAYLLAADLAGGHAFTTELPAWYVATDEELSALVGPLWEHPGLDAVERHGNSFWLSTGGGHATS